MSQRSFHVLRSFKRAGIFALGALASTVNAGPPRTDVIPASTAITAANAGPRQVNPAAPAFDPAVWDDAHLAKVKLPPDGLVTVKNFNGVNIIDPSCYAYAADAPTLQGPGSSLRNFNSEIMPVTPDPMSLDPEDVRRRALKHIVGVTIDGARFIGQNPVIEPGKYLIALYERAAEPGCKHDNCAPDYHFVRQDNDGGWSHLIGKGPPVTDNPPKRIDAKGNTIVDPKVADIRINDRPYDFVGYFQVPQGGLALDGKFLPTAGLNSLSSYTGGAVNPGMTLVAQLHEADYNLSIFLQRDANGQWGRVWGNSIETIDRDGQPITNPNTANFGTYKFSKYLLVPNGATEILTIAPTSRAGNFRYSSAGAPVP